MKTKFISFIVIICIIVSQITAFAAVAWPAPLSTGLDMPVRPTDGYVSMQNPPNFTWQHVPDAVSYELCVYTDEACTKKKYFKDGLTHNYYNFEHTFEPGKTYWWRVRFYTEDGSYSEWTAKRRFRIDPDAYEFTLPETDVLVAKIPQGHPRVITTSAELEDFRNNRFKNVNAANYYDYIVKRAESHSVKIENGTMDLTKPQRPSDDDPDAVYNYERGITGVYTKLIGYAYECGYAYLVSGNEKYANAAKKILTAISPWGFVMKNGKLVYDKDDITGYSKNDTIHRVITYKSAMVYDWIYHTMTEEERAPIRYMIQERGKILANHLIDGAKNAIRKKPYDSHGWTAFGFLGITAYAMYGEFPEAEYWFREIIPAYAAIFPPWSYQDGGWSQGTDYWKDSTIHGQEFLDVMARGGIINYYESAWGSQEYLWSLYAFPAGSYGAFGDDSNLRLPGVASADSVSNTAYYTGNPTAKWILETLGGEYANTINTFYIDTSHIEPEPPENYPLSHEFEDIGWAVMTSDLMDTNRVQAYLKSSYYGSFNHSHADQNSFIIQAFGKKLAVKSGYYESYHSVHDKTITRATFAHNSITHDGGKGQPSQTDDFTAKGDITSFVTQMSFDCATGDATPAYKGEIGKYIRNFIYIRPGTFVVIDDLEAKKGTTSTFEWWLNAEDGTLTEYTDKGATIEVDNANLKADVIYPQNTTVTFYDGFINPLDGLYYEPNASRDFDGWPHHDRVNFSTKKVDKTKMVVTMSVYEDGESADVPHTEYAPDGSYIKLTFKDGNVCIVNMGNPETYVTCDDITFAGEAVTYNDNSIMLTNGTYLLKGMANLIMSDKKLTCAMGYGQISMSVPEDAHVDFETSTKYFKADGNTVFTDHKGRNANDAIGVNVDYSLADYGYLGMDVKKGNVMLLADDSSVTVAGLAPEISVNRTSDGKYQILWNDNDSNIYDVLLNGIVYEDVSSPYTIVPDGETKTYNVAVRTHKDNLTSPWSDFVHISPDGKSYYSTVRYKEIDGNIKAEVFATNPQNEKYSFATAIYENDVLKEIVPFYKTGTNSYEATFPLLSSGQNAKTYLWTEDGISPRAPLAEYNSYSLSLNGIAIDGEYMEEYSDNKDEYDIFLPYGTECYPLITPAIKDNSTYCFVSHDYSNLTSCINLTAQNGDTRRITLNYILEDVDKHVVTGASEEAQFKGDTGRSIDEDGNATGKVSTSNVGVLTYDVLYKDGVTQKQTVKNLPLYTNLDGNHGGNLLGSRIASDRPPAGTQSNHSEFHNPNKSYVGYDHFVFPNDTFYKLTNEQAGGQVLNARFNFSLEENAEIVILASGAVPGLVKNGFSQDATEKISNGRYMNVPNFEDKYYNIMYNGLSESDFVGRYPVNYDVLSLMVDVAPIEGLSSWADYVNAAPTKEDFTVADTDFKVEGLYVYRNIYTKRFENITDTTSVEIDFGDFGTTVPKLLVIVRPLTPKKPISDFVFTGPRTFEDVPEELLADSDDVMDEHTAHSPYSTGNLAHNAEIGAYVYSEANLTNAISYLNTVIGLEGAYLIPIQNSVAATAVSNNWMRAYYYGMEAVGGNSYPAMMKKSNDWYEFTLNKSADLYVVTTDEKPLFIDDTWQNLNISGSAVVASGLTGIYGEVYVKHIDANPGEPARVSMKTPGTGSTKGNYITFVKFTE